MLDNILQGQWKGTIGGDQDEVDKDTFFRASKRGVTDSILFSNWTKTSFFRPINFGSLAFIRVNRVLVTRILCSSSCLLLDPFGKRASCHQLFRARSPVGEG